MTKPSKRTCRQGLWLLACGALTVLVVSLLLVTALWQGRDPLLNRYLKPRLEQFLGNRLDARVAIARLELEPRHLRVGGLVLEKPGHYRLAVLGLSLDFSLERLRRGELDGLRLFAPELSLWPAALGGETPGPPAELAKPPVVIDFVEISGGRLTLNMDGRAVVLRDLDAELRGVPEPEFQLRFVLGDEQPLALAAAGSLAWNGAPLLQVRELAVDGQELLAAPLLIRPLPEGLAAGGEILSPHLERGQVESWFAAFGETSPLPPDLEFAARDLALGVEWAGARSEGRLRCAELRVSRQALDLPLEDVDLHVSGGPAAWQARGQARIAGDLEVRLSLEGAGARLGGEAWVEVPALASLAALVGHAQPLPLTGGFDARARFDWQEQRLALDGEFQGRPLSRPTRPAQLSLAPLSGRLRLAGPVESLAGELALDLDGRPFLEVRGDGGRLDARMHQTSLAALAGLLDSAEWPELLEKKGHIAATADLRRTRDGWQGRAALRGDGWRASGFDFGASEAGGRFSWRGDRLDLAEVSLQTSLGGRGLSIPRLSLRGSGHWRNGTARLDLAQLRLEEVDYLAADDMSALAGGSLDLAGRLDRRGDGELDAVLRGTARAREALVHAFYGDLAQLPLAFALSARWLPEQNGLVVENLRLDLSGIGTLDGHGTWRHGQIGAEAKATLPRLAEGFNTHLRPLLAPLYPLLGNLDLHGALTLQGEGQWAGDAWWAAGSLLPENLELHLADGSLALGGLGGRLPFALTSQGNARPLRQEGLLTFARLQAGPLTAENQRFALISDWNHLSFVDPWVLDLADGAVAVENLRLGWEPQGLFIGGRTRITELDLERLTRALELTPMQGRLAADLGEFEYLGGYLQSQGEARLEAFGGVILARNLRARDLFSSYRGFEGDIDLNGLDLAQLTQTFEFGEINGILDGYIHDLRLFGKVPSAFVAEVATRERGRRNISVKALNNLAVISQGGLSAALSRGVYRFIDFYRYRKMGVFCVLRNDVFVLRGTARPGSELYIVDGGWLPPRLDVLAPRSAISFREMLRRLGRIDRAGTR